MFNFFSKAPKSNKFWFKTDIHCHVLPGIDDGAQETDASLAIISDLAEMGIERIIASPHITQATFENNAETLDAAQASLDAALAAAGIDIPVTHSAENRIDDLLINNIKNNTLLTLPGNYVIIENSFMQEPMQIDDIVFDLQVRGYHPILAHPERYGYYHNHPGRYRQLHEKGLLFQVNALSLAGAYGRSQKKMGEYLIEKGYVDFIGTDSHNTTHTALLKKYLSTKDAARHAAALPNLLNDIL